MSVAPSANRATTTDARPRHGFNLWVVYAGILLLLLGGLNAMYGLAAIINDQVLHVGGNGGVVLADYTTWGWVTLGVAALMTLTGVGLISGWGFARWLGIGFAALNALAQFGSISSFPLWAILIIALDVMVIYQLCVRWEPARE
jgi:hypothetical protein